MIFMCKNCKAKPVIKLNSGDSLCRNCFVKYFEMKARKTISVFRLLAKKLRQLGHRFPNARADYIAEARKHRDSLRGYQG